MGDITQAGRTGRTGRTRIHVAAKPASPTGAGTLATYADLRAKAEKFSQGKYNLLVIAGPPGIAKTTTFLSALERTQAGYCLIEANASPFGTYVKLWENRNSLVVLDDADQLSQTAPGKRLLKQLGQTEQWKRLSWESKAMQGDKAPAPSEFSTSSNVCIITNQWEFRGGDVHTEAVEDRGMCYVFDPAALEIHEYTAGWFWDQEIFDAVAEHLPYVRKLTCRLYFKLDQMKRAGDDWLSYLLSQMYDEDDLAFKVKQLLMDSSYKSNNERAGKFQAAGLGSKATFYRYAADLGGRVGLTEVPAYTVTGVRPSPRPDPMGE